jgi:hypothetical protein
MNFSNFISTLHNIYSSLTFIAMAILFNILLKMSITVNFGRVAAYKENMSNLMLPIYILEIKIKI